MLAQILITETCCIQIDNLCLLHVVHDGTIKIIFTESRNKHLLIGPKAGQLQLIKTI